MDGACSLESRCPCARAANNEELIIGAESVIAEPLIALTAVRDHDLGIFELDMIGVEYFNSKVCKD
jgi:hypothetical protein